MKGLEISHPELYEEFMEGNLNEKMDDLIKFQLIKQQNGKTKYARYQMESLA